MRKIIRLPNSTDKYVGARMRMRRLVLDMNQDDLGKALSITFQQIQKYEKGTNRISASRLQAIQVLQVPVPFFFEGAPLLGRNSMPQSTPSDGVAQLMATRDGLALVKAFTRVFNKGLRRQIIGLIEDLGQSDAAA